jgi:hypothetical protein
MVYLPIKPVDVVNIAFLFITFFYFVFFFKGVFCQCWCGKSILIPKQKKTNTYLRNDKVLTYYILFKLVFTWLSVEQSSDWKRQRNTLYGADKQVLATVVIGCKNKTRITWIKQISIYISKVKKLGIR